MIATYCRSCGSCCNESAMRLRKTFQISHDTVVTLTFLRICSLAFRFSSFLASITLLETKLIKSAILDFFGCTLTISFKYRGSVARRESWLIVVQKNGGEAGFQRKRNCASSKRRFLRQGDGKQISTHQN